MTEDRTYWHVPGARSWHAKEPMLHGVLCRLWAYTVAEEAELEVSDRLPPTAHLCGNCARIIAARTDIEPASAP